MVYLEINFLNHQTDHHRAQILDMQLHPAGVDEGVHATLASTFKCTQRSSSKAFFLYANVALLQLLRSNPIEFPPCSLLVVHVVHALFEGQVDRVVAASLGAHLVHVAVPVQGDGHYSDGEIECLLDPVVRHSAEGVVGQVGVPARGGVVGV